MQHSGIQKFTFLIIPLLFLLYSAPGALDFVFHFPDEKYYTDAVLQMMDKGDYFTPYKADGSPRFLKPIITYWLLIASYKIFGVSTFSSRIFFWLAGAILVLITYLMTKSLTRKKQTSVIAAFIAASNPLVLMSASRSIPDILLTLFLTISAWGFLELMLSEKKKKRFYWMAYLGAALAFETKGIPAAAFAGISMIFLILNPWRKVKFKQLFEPFSMIVAILVALSWFIIMYVKHGSVYLDSFFADQVGERVSSKISLVFKNGGLGIVNMIAYLIPWIILFFSRPRRLKEYISASGNENKAIIGFIATWVILIFLMSAAVFKFYDRYILPGIPLIAIIFAMVFAASEIRFKRGIIFILFAMNLVMLVINSMYSIFILPDKILIVGVFTSGLILILWLSKVFRKAPGEVIIANGVMLFYFSAFILLYPLLMPNPGKQLVNNLYEKGASPSEKIYVYGNIRAASNLRIQSFNKLDVVSMDTVFQLPAESNNYLVFDEREKQKLDLTNYTVFKGSEEWLRVPVSKFPEFLQPAVENIKNDGTKYLIAKPEKQD